MKIVSLTSPKLSNQPQVRQNLKASASMKAPLTHDQVCFGNAKSLVTDAEKIFINEARECKVHEKTGVLNGLIFKDHVVGQQRPVVAMGAKNIDCIFNDVLGAWANNAEQLHLHIADKVTIVSLPPVKTEDFKKAIRAEQKMRSVIREDYENRPISQLLKTVQESREKYQEGLKGIFDKAGITVKEVEVKDIEAQ